MRPECLRSSRLIKNEPATAFSYDGQTLKTHQKTEAFGGKPAVVNHELTEANHFASEMDHFSRSIINDQTQRTASEEGLADMKILAALDRSIRESKPVGV